MFSHTSRSMLQKGSLRKSHVPLRQVVAFANSRYVTKLQAGLRWSD